MIKRLYIDNYKCLVNFDLLLQEVTLLVGANGVGKTSVLDVVFALRQLLAGVAKAADAFPSSTLTRWQSRDLQVIELDLELEGDLLNYRLELKHEKARRQCKIKLEKLSSHKKPLFECKDGEAQLYTDSYVKGPKYPVDSGESALARVAPRGDNTRLTRMLDYVRKVTVCGLYPSGFETESATEDTVLDRDGRNFASWYRNLTLERPDLVHEFMIVLREVIDDFRNIRMEKAGIDTRAMMVGFGADDRKYELRLSEISDGQRAMIALYSLVHLAAGQGYTLFLDEPDNYVALAEIQPWLMHLSDACGSEVPQAVLCSHHPELIDYLGADKGLLMEREASGVITVKKLRETVAKNKLKLSESIARGWQR